MTSEFAGIIRVDPSGPGGPIPVDDSGALRAAGVGTWEYRAGTWRWSSDVCALIGRSSDPRCVTAPLSALIHPADELRARAKLAEALASRDVTLYQDEFRLVRPDGQSVWFLARGEIRRTAAGEPESVAGVLVDITDRKRREDELKLASAQFEHRTKNVLSIVQSIAVQSFAEDASLEHVREVFLNRLHAVARTYAALAAHGHRGASLNELVAGELEPFGARADSEGPAVVLTPTAARSLALMLHELAAESARTGTLSVPGGTITVRWEVNRDGPEPALRLQWSERGEPRRRPGATANSETGLLKRIGAAFGITSRLERTPWGIKYLIEVPLSVVGEAD